MPHKEKACYDSDTKIQLSCVCHCDAHLPGGAKLLTYVIVLYYKSLYPLRSQSPPREHKKPVPCDWSIKKIQPIKKQPALFK